MVLLLAMLWLMQSFQLELKSPWAGIPEKKQWGGGGWGYRISRGIKEIARGISRAGSWFFALEFPRDLTLKFMEFPGRTWSFLSEISRGKVKKPKLPGGSKKYVLNPPFVFLWNSPIIFKTSLLLWTYSAKHLSSLSVSVF